MKKAKRFLQDHFLDKYVNIFMFTCYILILIIQIFQLYSNFFKSNFSKLYALATANPLIVSLISALISAMVPLFLLIGKKFWSKAQEKTETYLDEINKPKFFPGIITNDMIKNKEVVFANTIDADKNNGAKPMILSRKNQIEEIYKMISLLRKEDNNYPFKFLFLVGISGAGKSTLLKYFLKDYLQEQGETVTYINKNYNNYKVNENIIKSENSTVVIFDQFETSLKYKSFYNYIQKLVENCHKKTNNNKVYANCYLPNFFQHAVTKPVVYIFTFTFESYPSIHQRFDSILSDMNKKHKDKYTHVPTHFIINDKKDINDIKYIINRFTGIDREEIESCIKYCRNRIEKNKKILADNEHNPYTDSALFLCAALARVELGLAPLVEFSVVAYIYELFKSEIGSNLPNYINNYDNIFDLYLNKWVEHFPHQETGKMLLYLLSHSRTYTEKDIEYITFEPEECFENHEHDSYKNNTIFNIINALKHNTFISVKENYDGFYSGISAIHDYISNVLRNYCFRNLPNGLRDNIDYYKKYVLPVDYNNGGINSTAEKEKIRNRYNTFYNKSSWLGADLILLAMLLVILFITAANITFSVNKVYLEHLPLITIGCMLATYYFHNSIIQSVRMLGYKYYIFQYIWGAVSVILCYLFPSLFGIFLGSTLLLFGCLQYELNNKTVYVVKESFKTKGKFYIGFGFLVISFGIFYLISPHYVYPLFFIIYVSGAISSHIKYSYAIERIGNINTIKQ